MNARCVFFDFDGTLIDSEGPDCRLLSRLMTEAGHPMTPGEVYKRFAGLPRSDIVTFVRDRYGWNLPESWKESYDAGRRELEKHVVISDGAEALLADLEKAGVLPCLTTASHEVRLHRVLGNCGLGKWFGNRMYHLDYGNRPKPFPDIYLDALRSTGADPEEVFAVEDSPMGVRAAVSAGIRCVGYTGNSLVGRDMDEKLLEAGAFLITPNFSDLRRLALGNDFFCPGS